MSAPIERPAPRRPGELWRILAGLAVVLGATAATLSALDAIPAWILGEPRDVRRVSSLQEAERRLGTRLVLPGYFPDTIAWPARTIRVMGGPRASAMLEFDGRDGQPRLLVAQTARPGDVPERLLAPSSALSEVAVALGEASAEPGALRRVVGPDGEVWQEVAFRHGGRQVLLRLKGSVDQAVRMAKSAREAP
jgi:hypothetical protein